MHNLYDVPKVLAQSNFWSQYYCLQAATSFRMNAGTTIDIDILLTNQKLKNNLTSALSSFDWTPLYLLQSVIEN